MYEFTMPRNEMYQYQAAFDLISIIAGDMVAYEYVSFLKRKENILLTLVHMGFSHIPLCMFRNLETVFHQPFEDRSPFGGRST